MSNTLARESGTALTLCAVAALAAVTTANVNAASTTAVPLRLHGTEAPIVMVRVQGKELPLQLDLGDASSLVLHPEVLAALRTEPTADTFKGFGMDGQIDTPIVRVDLVELGDLKLSGVAARQDVHDEAFRDSKKTEVGTVGFIGVGVFNSGQLLLDYSRMSLTISLPPTSGTMRNICHGRAVPLIERSWGLMTAVSTDVGELEFGLDTGAPTIVMSRSAATAAHLATDLDSTVFRKFVIGSKNFGHQQIDIWDMPTPTGMAGLIGHPFFLQHVLCFDYPRHTLHIQ
jgi:hypothetical protein